MFILLGASLGGLQIKVTKENSKREDGFLFMSTKGVNKNVAPGGGENLGAYLPS